jgi:hypothetical protein
MSKVPWLFAPLALVVLLNLWLLRKTSQLRFGFLAPLFVAIVWGGSSTMVALLSHSAKFTDLAMLNCVALAGVGLVVAIFKVPPTCLFAGPCCFIAAMMLAVQQNTFNKIPVISFILIAVAPLSLGVISFEKAKAWFEPRPLVLALFFAVPCLVAVGLALRAEL